MFCALASLAHAWAFAVLLLHWNVAFCVWQSMNLKEPGEETVQEQLELNKEDDMFETMSPAESFDALMSGGGISGLFLARALGKAGTKVLLCEFHSLSCLLRSNLIPC
jgi:heterodisulfide reductase subunit A-like polyferredoxin